MDRNKVHTGSMKGFRPKESYGGNPSHRRGSTIRGFKTLSITTKVGTRSIFFLRTQEKRNGVPAPYTYLGRLKYHSHDRERQQPVHIAWQLQQWPIPGNVLNRMALRLEGEAPPLPSERREQMTPL